MASTTSLESEMETLSNVLHDPVGFYHEVINRSGQYLKEERVWVLQLIIHVQNDPIAASCGKK